MKLRTIKELKNGTFKKKNIDNTQAGFYGFIGLFIPWFLACWAMPAYFYNIKLVWLMFWLCAYYLYIQLLKIIIGYLYWCEVYIDERTN